MAENRQPSKLAVILHADVAGSTALVQLDEHLAHERIQDTFRRFSDTITKYHGHVRELRGDALLAEFERAWPRSRNMRRLRARSHTIVCLISC